MSNKPVSGEDAAWQRWDLRPIEPPAPPAFLTPAKARARLNPVAPEAVAEPEPEVVDEPEIDPRGVDVPTEEVDIEPETLSSYPTAAELEAIHQEAWQAGFEAGHAEGLDKGREEGKVAAHDELRPELQAELALLQALRTRLETSLTQLESDLAPQLLSLALECADRLVGAHVAACEDALEPLLTGALANLAGSLKQARLRVHPDDLIVARRVIEREAADASWQYIPDASVGRGGCLIDLPSGRIDLRLATRREALGEALGAEPVPGDIEADHVVR